MLNVVPCFWLSFATKHLFKVQSVLLSTFLLTNLTSFNKNPVAAQATPGLEVAQSSAPSPTVLSCVTSGSQALSNQAIANVTEQRAISNRIDLSATVRSSPEIRVINNGTTYEAGEFANTLGIIADSLINEFIQQGLTPEEANAATLVTFSQWASLANSSSAEVIAALKQNLIVRLGQERTELIAQIPDSLLLTTLAGLQPSTLAAIGLLPAEIESLSQIEISPQIEGSLALQIQSVTTTAVNSLKGQKLRRLLPIPKPRERQNLIISAWEIKLLSNQGVA